MSASLWTFSETKSSTADVSYCCSYKHKTKVGVLALLLTYLWQKLLISAAPFPLRLISDDQSLAELGGRQK